MLLFLLQVSWCDGDLSGSVVKTSDQSFPDVGWMVRSEVQISVGVGGLPVDCNVQSTILLSSEMGVEEW